MVLLGAGLYGLRLRENLWRDTSSIRFRWDVSNGFNQGRRAVDLALRDMPPGTPRDEVTWLAFLNGYRQVYADVEARSQNDRYGLDYPPLRLLAVSLWMKHVARIDPDARRWREEHTTSMLLFNTVMEAIAALAAFGLVVHWMRRETRAQALPGESPGWNAPVSCGLIAALLLWFDPGVLLNAHVWPQWDVWAVTAYLLAALLCSWNLWFCAGVIGAFGCMLKGQTLLVLPILALWPLFMGQFGATTRVLIGFASGLAMVTAIWLVQGALAWLWIGSAGMALAATLPWAMRRRPLPATDAPPESDAPRRFRERGWWIASAIAAMLVLWPWLGMEHWSSIWIGLPLAAFVIAAPRLVPRRSLPLVAAMTITAAVFTAGHRFDGDMAWYRVGFVYGTDQYREMKMGPTDNLASILAARFGWKLKDTVALFGMSDSLTMQSVLRGVYFTTLILCSIGMAMHARRGGRYALVALTAPWICMFAILPQMHERYLLYGGAISVLMVGVSLGMTLLHLLVTLISFGMMFHTMPRDPNILPGMRWFFQQAHPGLGWAILLVAGVFLYLSLRPQPKHRPMVETPDPH